MGEKILAVRADELKRHIAFRRFFALPKEEIGRLHAAVEILAVTRDQAMNDPAYRPLVIHAAIHFNYIWFTHQPAAPEAPQQGERSLVISAHIPAQNPIPLFLDDQLKSAAARIVNERVLVTEPYELRLVGLLNDDTTDLSRRELGFVYVLKLRRAGIESRDRNLTRIRLCGNGELQLESDRFEARSRILIDNLYAL